MSIKKLSVKTEESFSQNERIIKLTVKAPRDALLPGEIIEKHTPQKKLKTLLADACKKAVLDYEKGAVKMLNSLNQLSGGKDHE